MKVFRPTTSENGDRLSSPAMLSFSEAVNAVLLLERFLRSSSHPSVGAEYLTIGLLAPTTTLIVVLHVSLREQPFKLAASLRGSRRSWHPSQANPSYWPVVSKPLTHPATPGSEALAR